ncbi:MAG: cytochrome [Rhizobium sp.]|nr:cytochrome [Rhizobium sp.]
MIKRILVASAICLMAVSAVVAAENMHDSREAAMKKIGGAMGGLSAIAKGEKPYDAATVKTSLTTISETIKVFPNYFPVGSEKDDEVASPKIWENMADFKAHADKLGADADTLLAQLPADQAAVGAAMGTLGKDCGSCHEIYRLKKK